MTILAVETSTEHPSVAVLKDGRIIDEVQWQSIDIASSLMSRIDYLLKKNKLPLSLIDRVAVSLGPGSWTGVRVGLSLAKGLVIGRRERLYGIYSAENIIFAFYSTEFPVCSLINALRGNFYYSISEDPSQVVITPPKIEQGKITEILDRLPNRTLVAGPAVAEISEAIWNQHQKLTVASLSYCYPKAGIAGRLAEMKIRKGIPSPLLEPFYER
ncbi:MAG: tRNA (adenosine(37)-N6)-threonylcarbamoyltransferase complex dimerization subunit type 1 TsaB [Candidatus Omnitrophica bacterium]|nr:tRNA (adenosine(37)-N6)-threonylcarbamoyltransferase complex dimerization subunit type 1 TsaB [Candidatus Omnitrophota bacterium]MCM8769915.1 tRNA (adenosine(37)-N6)-threonylcarbamoyltransferase complex dimerization subunit type 1 TsaB [Candidatus Omnitrophota bacterium]